MRCQGLSDIEKTPELQKKWYREFLWALQHSAIPEGRIISNAGVSLHKPATSTINCTVSWTIEDSMDDILQKFHESGLTLKVSCGIGYEFSTLRPKSSFVAGASTNTSGPLSFMDIYDKICFTVSSAGGWHGPQTVTFDIGHPDILDFIEAVEQDLPWHLTFPITQDEHNATKIDLKGKSKVLWRDWPSKDNYIRDCSGLVACRIYNTIKARRLWDLIMSSIYDYAEPGFILIDKVNEDNNN